MDPQESITNGKICSSESTSFNELLLKHSGQLPRYTSYPTAMELKPLTGKLNPIAHWDEDPSEPVALYVHLPFCPRLCYFCACTKVITSNNSTIERYLHFLESEVKLLESSLEYVPFISEIHLGGGSPSYLDAEELNFVDSILTQNFYVLPHCVKSIEIDPRTLDKTFVTLLGKLHFTRASIGIQDFDARVQRVINREQSVALTARACKMLRENGIQSLNFDLIYGLPEQTTASFERTIHHILALRPSRLAVYGYAHVPWRVKTQRKFSNNHLPSSLERAELFLLAHKELTRAGYVHIGLDHFALPDDELVHARENGYLKRNFMGYTAQKSARVLGIGLSAISDNRTFLYQNATTLPSYEEAIKSKRLPIAKALERSSDDLAREKIIQELMCYGSTSPSRIAESIVDLNMARQIFADAKMSLSSFIREGLIRQIDERVMVTEKGKLFLRAIASVFDLYRNNQKNDSIFSQAL